MVNNRSRLLLFAPYEDMAVYGQYLSHIGWDVHYVTAADEALRLAGTGTVEVLVTDQHIDGAAGCAVVRAFKGHHRSRLLPAIVLISTPSQETAARAAGADVVVLKPCLPQTLAAVIDDVAPRVLEFSVTAPVDRLLQATE